MQDQLVAIPVTVGQAAYKIFLAMNVMDPPAAASKDHAYSMYNFEKDKYILSLSSDRD